MAHTIDDDDEFPTSLDFLRNVKGLDEDGTATDREVLEGLRDYQLECAHEEGADRAYHLEYARKLTEAIKALEVVPSKAIISDEIRSIAHDLEALAGKFDALDPETCPQPWLNCTASRLRRLRNGMAMIGIEVDPDYVAMIRIEAGLDSIN